MIPNLYEQNPHPPLRGEKEIDYLNIDVEGHELDVLRQNDWGKYRPKIISVEIIKTNLNNNTQSLFKQGGRRYWEAINDLPNSPIHQFLVKQGYQAFAKGIASVFYVDTQQEAI
ncbi:MAG: FkbM family methyltransferase [Nitrospinae bacterium]|nr:FkbM family methyltransferase [Nitrospinota bacterium]MBI3813151.1 FkbM family methyltransferase [Nitrospinota bacterium]